MKSFSLLHARKDEKKREESMEEEKEIRWNEMKGNELGFINFSKFLVFQRSLTIEHEEIGFCEEFWTTKGCYPLMKVFS